MNTTLNPRRLASGFLYILLLFIPQMINADNSQTEITIASEALPVMPVIYVEATRIAPTTGMTIIDREMIENLPKSNGNLSELLRTIPGVQFSEDFKNSKTAGEIRPPEVSISGGRPEDNNYTLDGTSNNSLLDPAYSDINNEGNTPGHSQELFILDHIIDNIKVFRANIPVRYGGFSGGVIDTETIDPKPEFGGQLSYSTTRSIWGKFHIDADDKEGFNNSTDADNQPDFTKQRLSTTLNVPLNKKMGLLFDYTQLQSQILLELVGNEKTQYRKNENIFLKYVVRPKSGTKIALSATYAPYEGTYYLKDTLNSDYNLVGGGWRLNGQLYQDINMGNIAINLNVQESYNNREAPANWYSWRATPSKNWGILLGDKVSKEGGFGDIEKQQRSFTTNIHFESTPTTIKTISHKINAGLESSYTQAAFNRTETAIKHTARLANGISCLPGDPECINGEQFIFYKQVLPEDNARAQILNLDIYIEDIIRKGKLTLRPGIRASYNNFQKNTDLAPRLTASIDFFKNTILTVGVSRYYNTSLLTLKLEEQKKPYERYLRLSYPNFWPDEPKPRTRIPASRTSNLETPYSDEWNIGLQQKVFSGHAEAIYINRDYKNQIVSVILDIDIDNYIYKEWRNTGRRTYEEFSLNWHRHWNNAFLSLSISWQKIKSNSSNYADQLEDDAGGTDYVWYNEKVILREELPPNNFNRPIKASLIYTSHLAYGFSFTNTTIFKDHYKALTIEGTDPTGFYDAYTVSTIPSALIFDWKISWISPNWRGNSVECTLDVLNVFNRKTHYGPEDDNYLLGRQFWAGMTYKF